VFDLLITGGMVADGTGATPRRADVGVSGGHIEAVGRLSDSQAEHTLNATGALVSPGFIDIHSHSDFTLLVDPRAQSQVFQGVTTEMIGNCGHGCAPIGDTEKFAGNIYGYSRRAEVAWKSFAGYLDALEQAAPAVNVASLVPNGNLRLLAVDDASKAASPGETAHMVRLLEEALGSGAWGFSTGLEYPAEAAASEAELAALCRAVAAHGGLYAAHTRNRETRAVEAVQEAVRLAKSGASGREERLKLQVSHIIPRRGGPAGSLAGCIEAVEQARGRGLDAAFDSHTRLHGITNLSNALPAWASEGGTAALRRRLGDRAARARLRKHSSIISSFALGGWERVSLYTSPARPEIAGRSFASLAPPGGDGWDAVFDALRDHADDPHAPLVICLSYDEAEVIETMSHELCTIGSDATSLAVDGPLAGEAFLGAFTWAGWAWRKLVTESRRLTVGQAVAKLTSAPAERMGLRDRGVIANGKRADVAVFGPASFRDTGTLESPNRLAQGVRHVVVNGTVTLEDGRLTGKRGGQVLRRGKS